MQTKSRPVTIYCSDELYAWIQRYAAQDSRSMSNWIARKLEQARAKTAPPAAAPAEARTA